MPCTRRACPLFQMEKIVRTPSISQYIHNHIYLFNFEVIISIENLFSYICMFESHLRQLIFSTALGVLCCFALFVCLTLLASFFLPSHLSFKDMYI